APLLRGVVAPATLDLDRPVLRLRRAADGTIALVPPDGAAAVPETPDLARGDAEEDARESAGLALMLRDLMNPAEDRAAHTALRRLSIHGGEVTVEDAVHGLQWRLEALELTLGRLPGGGLDGDGEARLAAVSEAGRRVALPVHVSGRAEQGRVSLRLDLPLLRPSDVAEVVPPLAPLAILDATLGLQARLAFDTDGRPLGAGLALQAAEGGTLRPRSGLEIAFSRLDAELSASPQRLVLEAASLRLPGEGGTAVEASGALARGAAGWSGPLDLVVSGLDLAAIPRLWPAALAPEAREAARLALVSGRLTQASLRLDLEADAPLESWGASGGSGRLLLTEAVLAPPGLGALRLDEAVLQATAAPGRLRLEALRLDLAAPAPDAPAPRLDGAGSFTQGEAGWEGTLELALDRTRFQDLPALWPRGLGEGAREWITANVTQGEITDGRWKLGLALDAGAAAPRLATLAGEARVSDAAVHFLRPMPPVRGVAATARFAREEIALDVTAGALAMEGGGARGAIQLRGATLRFLFTGAEEPDMADLAFDMAGPLTDLGAALRHPRLRLFDRRPFPVTIAAGSFEGRLAIGFPLRADLPIEDLRLRAEARVAGGRFTRLVFDRDVEEAALEMTADLDQLRLSGGGVLAAIPFRYGLEADFRAGPPAQVVMRDTVTLRAAAEQLAALGLDLGPMLGGPVGIEARGERRRNGQGSYQVSAALREASMSFPPLRWQKAPGAEGRAEAQVRLLAEQVTSIEAIRITAADLALRGRAAARAGRIERVEIQDSSIGASRLAGDARAGARPGEAWSVTLRGPVLDLRAALAAANAPAEPRAPAAPAQQPPLALDLRFDQVMLGPGRDVYAVQLRARMDGAGVAREASLRGRTARTAGGFELTLAPGAGQARTLRGSAEDGGALLRAFGITRGIDGGRLTLSGNYATSGVGAPLEGTAELDGFSARDAPAFGKLLQAVTVFGLIDAMQGGSGLSFQRAVVPFTLTPEALRVEDARAFSPSLGLTVRGRVLRETNRLDLEGTIVPAYVLNTMLGNLPVIGRLFSPEQGGGVFAASFRVRGPAEDPEVSVNPLAAVTPGFLRGLFGGGPGLGGPGSETRR
nr:AsmA-like C-terminal region-containing protein [Rubritepida sp.]